MTEPVRAFRLILRQFLLLVAVAVAVFAMMKASPVDPVDAYLGPAMARVGPEQKAQIAASWGLNRPVPDQFFAWAGNVLSGNLGFSSAYNMPVSRVLADRALASLALTGLAWALSGVLGFALGLLAGATAGRWPDRVIRVYCYTLAATPTFWLAMLTLAVFSVQLGWAPICCAGPIGVLPEDVTLGQRFEHLILPLAVLTAFGVAQIALHTRVKLIEVFESDYVLLARAQGASTWDIVRHHGVRNAGIPALTALFATMGEIIGGSVLAEQVFAWPGLGRATVEAGLKGDVPLLMAIALLTALLVSTGNMIADELTRRIDPRIRAGSR
ncbi:ABC transporter permease [Pseudoruegeria sp. SK021]|nr:ABC transporter permease [Pseudoruegeria sp. SK021]